MIPKIIHYCWFGGNALPETAQNCIQSWHKFCPDYEIIEWNETNYDIKKSQFINQAYENKKWAFVSDYARLDIIYNYGGIYLDTDVEIIKSIDKLREFEMYAGFEKLEGEMHVNFGLGYGAVKCHPYLKEMIDYYNGIEFPKDDRNLAKISCPVIQTKILERHGLIPNGQSQTLKRCKIFSADYFSPKDFLSGVLKITPDTYSVHHYNMSWFPIDKMLMRQKEWEMMRKYNSNKLLVKWVMFPKKIMMHYRNGGVKGVIEYFRILRRNRWGTQI